MEYYLLKKTDQLSNIVIAVELRAVTEVLGSTYERFKQLALKATMRKAQLIVFTLSSEIYKHYLETVVQVQILEKRLFYPFKIENYPDEFYVVSFNAMTKQDNTEEVFDECLAIKHEIQKTYGDLLSEPSFPGDQKKFLQQQLNVLQNCFQKLKLKATSNC